MFKKVLIANRGEIACRVATTCRRLGVRSVAVYSDVDAQAQHVALADEAVHIGGASAADSYLRIERILEAARRTGADAIHPGYGFLSENEDFALACREAGIVFIGPPVEAIAAMGSKAAAKSLMHSAAVPLVPGYHGDDQSPALLQTEADAIGYPVLLKASAGGGGKGMRVVERAEDFGAALLSCQREAASSFSNDRVLIEKYLSRPRHVEVQVFADTHGNCLYLFDRDCSVQRRHQKVLEEAPAPGLSGELRRAMGEAAVAAARAVQYVGAGTVEFIMNGAQFYFMEMNTRLQVEHPVTEMVTGLDLVEWQLRVADGEALPFTQDALRLEGHAIEARIYAERPARGFLPSTGRIAHLRVPDAVAFVRQRADASIAPLRIDSAVVQGDSISPYYDPMLAKLIAHGADRSEALTRLTHALAEFEVVGPDTNIDFLLRIVQSQPFVNGDLDTGLIERHQETLLAPPSRPSEQVLALASAAWLARQQAAALAASAMVETSEMSVTSEAAARSPWLALGAWRLNGYAIRTIDWRQHGLESGQAAEPAGEGGQPQGHELSIEEDAGGMSLCISGTSRRFAWRRAGVANEYEVTLDGLRIRAHVIVEGEVYHVFHEGAFALEAHSAWDLPEEEDEGGAHLNAPMPGKIIAVHVKAGERVERGAPLVVMEAMKMEHTIVAPMAGTVERVLYAVGEQVGDGAQLLVMAVEP